ncbi:NUDIX domain-containing protein [Bifidobacterium platyrrhinorum]|uniref:NUDIX domain-containing protein n=1 Tax=Bifidobacterium platyrrhinorum TaxID=2661628 RepID=A0A6L9SWY3_9BIFI|nr:NUDIX hydrolase [Bifidobacterium platyrrhinorum]NEG55681.1 NUDIX domain-containing protein [Bifidobacterium platyrrhinorum]
MTNETHRQFDPWRPSPLKEESREQILASHYFNVDRVKLESVQAGSIERTIVHVNNGDEVAVLAVTEDGRLPLVEQYRVPIHRWTLEIPGGHAKDPDERPLDVARRKLHEEGGYEAERFSQIARYIGAPGFSTMYTSLYYATGLTPAARTEIGPETPRSEVRLYTVDEAMRMVLNGTIIDAKSIIAIQRLYAGLSEGEDEPEA